MCIYRYSHDSYMQNKGHVRQGFGGNYRRNDNGAQKPPSPGSQPPFKSDKPFYQQQGQQPQQGPASPTINPPPTETVVKVATVMTVTKSLPPAEQKVQLEQGPSRMIGQPESHGTSMHYPAAENNGRIPNSNPIDNQNGYPGANTVSSNPDSHHSGPGRPLPPDPEQTQSPSVRAMLSNFQSSQPRDGPQPWTPRRQLEPTSNYQPVPRTKVQELKESLMRLSNENLNRLGVDSDNISPSQSEERLHPLPPRANTVSAHHVSPLAETNQSGPASQEVTSSENMSLIGGDSQPITTSVTNGAEQEEEAGLSEDESEGHHPGAPPRVHKRQKSHEEIECEKQAALLAERLKEDDKRLSDVRF